MQFSTTQIGIIAAALIGFVAVMLILQKLDKPAQPWMANPKETVVTTFDDDAGYLFNVGLFDVNAEYGIGFDRHGVGAWDVSTSKAKKAATGVSMIGRLGGWGDSICVHTDADSGRVSIRKFPNMNIAYMHDLPAAFRYPQIADSETSVDSITSTLISAMPVTKTEVLGMVFEHNPSWISRLTHGKILPKYVSFTVKDVDTWLRDLDGQRAIEDLDDSNPESLSQDYPELIYVFGRFDSVEEDVSKDKVFPPVMFTLAMNTLLDKALGVDTCKNLLVSVGEHHVLVANTSTKKVAFVSTDLAPESGMTMLSVAEVDFEAAGPGIEEPYLHGINNLYIAYNVPGKYWAILNSATWIVHIFQFHSRSNKIMYGRTQLLYGQSDDATIEDWKVLPKSNTLSVTWKGSSATYTDLLFVDTGKLQPLPTAVSRSKLVTAYNSNGRRGISALKGYKPQLATTVLGAAVVNAAIGISRVDGDEKTNEDLKAVMEYSSLMKHLLETSFTTHSADVVEWIQQGAVKEDKPPASGDVPDKISEAFGLLDSP